MAMGLTVVLAAQAAGCAGQPRPRYSQCVPTHPTPSMHPADVLLGPLRPTRGIEVSPEHRWAVLGQVLSDTSGDGRLAIHYGEHAVSFHDARTPIYYDARHEAGLIADGFLDVSPSRTRVALELAGDAVVIDATTGDRWTVGPLPPVHAFQRLQREGRRDGLLFVDDDTALVWTADGTLATLNFTRRDATQHLQHPGWLTELRLVAGWAVVGVADARPLTPGEQDRVYRASVARSAPPESISGIRVPEETSWAVHLASGRVVELPSHHVWPAAWGLVFKDRTGTLMTVTLDGVETVVATGCTQDVLVVPGLVTPGVAHDCARPNLQWVGLDGVATAIPVETLPFSRGPEDADRIVRGGAVWAFRPNGEFFESSAHSVPSGDTLIVAPEGRRAYVADSDTARLGRLVDRGVAPNGYDAVDSLPGGAFMLRRNGDQWQPVPRPAEGHTCLTPRTLPPQLWGQCFSPPDGTLLLGVADADGTALAVRGWHLSCGGTGAVQPVWLDVRTLGEELSPAPAPALPHDGRG